LFDTQGEDAAHFYASIFKNSKIVAIARYGDAGPPKGSVMTVEFELDSRPFAALNGGPMFKFNEAISFQVSVRTRARSTCTLDKLGSGGEPGPCGWLKDKFGLSWQIVPEVLPKVMSDPNPDRARRATEAMLKMGKLDIAALEAAAAG
jgi:predicted 3-demethylubiquinone-9 3-methyltransferase (glyoxalase superfamily)